MRKYTPRKWFLGFKEKNMIQLIVYVLLGIVIAMPLSLIPLFIFVERRNEKEFLRR